MNGRLIVIEGIDGSGKSTQLELLRRHLSGRTGVRVQHFPRYDEDSSVLLRMYLRGDFGENPGTVNPYAASSFFAADRFAAFCGELGEHYRRGGTVLCDRYTSSNAVHQASKLSPEEQDRFVAWLFDYEYRLLEIPKPSLTLFLDMPPEHAAFLRAGRDAEDGTVPDIHESSLLYLHRCADTAHRVAQRQGWKTVRCVENGDLRPHTQIASDIAAVVDGLLFPHES